MTERLTLAMYDPEQALKAIDSKLWPLLLAHLKVGRRMVLELREEKRSNAENALLHAMVSHIAKTKEWAGSKHDIDTWKRLLVAAWCRARNEQVEILPALDGHGVDIVFRKTSKLTRKECAELIDFVFAWGVQNDIAFPEPKRRELIPPPRRTRTVDPATGEIL